MFFHGAEWRLCEAAADVSSASSFAELVVRCDQWCVGCTGDCNEHGRCVEIWTMGQREGTRLEEFLGTERETRFVVENAEGELMLLGAERD
jgi:hypothetical protein